MYPKHIALGGLRASQLKRNRSQCTRWKERQRNRVERAEVFYFAAVSMLCGKEAAAVPQTGFGE
ncbi:Uncharacterized protein APZ42_019048 [Daphnia magna]|uniref:Uncharacterized protein n=1 Tax=Daphnia magna TaxID=35525 RepID=A0A164YLQ1_9CRUS|nr:Uncharacterized protein APZ42_019048 [Daphnia magna]